MSLSRDKRRKSIKRLQRALLPTVKATVKKEKGIDITDKQARALINGAMNARLNKPLTFLLKCGTH